MKIVFGFNGRNKGYYLGLLLIILTLQVYGQSCDCPPVSQCGACQGGVISLTLRYNGVLLPAIITAEDQSGLLNTYVVSAGDIFTVTGSLPDGRFEGGELKLKILGLLNATVNTSCGVGIFQGSTFGSFTVVTGESKDGGQLCCAPSDIESIPPVISNCPGNFQITPNQSACSSTVRWSVPTATDNCGTVVLTSTHDPGESFPNGTTQVVYTATDKYGNTATCKFNVTVVDNTKPVISGCSANITSSADETCQASVSWPVPTATDNCGTVTLVSTHQPGDIFPLGTTSVTYTATDGSGNFSECTFDVMVTDLTAPILSGYGDVVVNADPSCSANVTWNPPTAEDCGPVFLTSSHSPGDSFPIGTTEVKYTATDTYGNISICKFNVLVKNEAIPLISNCPGDIHVKSNEIGQANVDWTEPTATTLCGEIVLTSSHQPGELFPAGTTAVEYKANDISGTTSYCQFNIVVTYDEIELDISKVVTPDGNGVNDAWIVKNIEKFSDNKIVIVDRWGSVIYAASGYNNENTVWKGLSRNGGTVPTGTYFYTISVRYGSKVFEKSGFIELIR